MTEDMNRFAFNTEGKICDYSEEEPKVLTEQDILEELNHLENTKNHFWEECEDVNWQNECLQEQLDKAIVPKFKVGQECYVVALSSVEKCKVLMLHIDKGGVVYECVLDRNARYSNCRKENNVYATKEEALARLKELQNNEHR